VRGVSDRISVRSVVGRFLEHSRIYYFLNGGEEEIYTGSADWMPRNLYERVEILTPIRDTLLRERVRHEILEAYLVDNVKGRILQRDGTYTRALAGHSRRKGSEGFNAQEFLVALAEGKRALETIPKPPARKGQRARITRER